MSRFHLRVGPPLATVSPSIADWDLKAILAGVAFSLRAVAASFAGPTTADEAPLDLADEGLVAHGRHFRVGSTTEVSRGHGNVRSWG